MHCGYNTGSKNNLKLSDCLWVIPKSIGSCQLIRGAKDSFYLCIPFAHAAGAGAAISDGKNGNSSNSNMKGVGSFPELYISFAGQQFQFPIEKP